MTKKLDTKKLKTQLFKTNISNILLTHVSGTRKSGYYPFQVQTGAGKTFSAINLLIYVSAVRLFGTDVEKASVSRIIYVTPRVLSVQEELQGVHQKIDGLVTGGYLSLKQGDSIKADICLLPGKKDILKSLLSAAEKKSDWAAYQCPGKMCALKAKGDEAFSELFRRITDEKDAPSFSGLFNKIKNAERRTDKGEVDFQHDDVEYLMRSFMDVILPRGEDGLLKDVLKDRVQRIVNHNSLEARALLPSLFLMSPDGPSVIMMSTTRLAYPFSNRVDPALSFGKKPEGLGFTFIIDECDAAKAIVQNVLLSMKTEHKFNTLRLMQRFAKLEDKPFYDEFKTNAAITELRNVCIRVGENIRTDLLLTVDNDTISAGQKMTATGDFVNFQVNDMKDMYFTDEDARRIMFQETGHDNDKSLLKYLNKIHAGFDLEVIPALQSTVTEVMTSIRNGKRTQAEADAVTTLIALNHFLEQTDINSPMLAKSGETDLAKALEARLNARGNDRKKAYDPGFVHTLGVSTTSFEPVMRRNILSGTAYGSFSTIMSTTPNKFLLNIAKHNLVIGLSATATVPSATSNFSLSYLEGSDVLIRMTEEEKKQVFADYLVARDYESAKDRGFEQRMLSIKSTTTKDLMKKILPILVPLVNASKSGPKKVYPEAIGELLGMSSDKSIEYVQQRIQKILNAADLFLSDADGEDAGWRMLCLLSTNMEEKVNGSDLQAFVEYMLKAVGSLYGKAPQVKFMSAKDFDERNKDAATANAPLIIITTYQNAGAGFNIQQKRTEPDHQIVNVHRSEPQMLGEPLTFPSYSQGPDVDFDTIYCERVTNPISANGKEHGDVISDIYALLSMHEEGYLSAKDTKQLMKNRISEHGFSVASLGILKENVETSLVQFRYISQAFGRLSRTSIRRKVQRFMVDQQMVNLLRQLGELQEKETSQEVMRLFKDLVQPTKSSAFKSRKDLESRGWRVNNHERMRKNLQKHQKSREDWAEMRIIVLKYPTYSGEVQYLLKAFYVLDEERNAVSRVFSNRKNMSDSKPYDLLMSKTQTEACMHMHESSEVASRLPRFMAHPVIRAYFEEKGYATSWVPDAYVLDEFVCQAVYTGALGEEALAALLYNAGVSIDTLPEKSHEFFDMLVGNDYPVDVKNYGLGMNPEHKEVQDILEWSSKKARDMGKRRCAVVSMFPTHADVDLITRHEFEGVEVMLISGVLTHDNQTCSVALNTLIEESLK